MEFSIVPKTIENEIDFLSLRIYPCPWPQFCTNFLKNVKNILMAQLAARLSRCGWEYLQIAWGDRANCSSTGFRPNSPTFFLANLIFEQGFSLFFTQFLTFLMIFLKFWNEWRSCLLSHYEFVKDTDEFGPRQIQKKMRKMMQIVREGLDCEESIYIPFCWTLWLNCPGYFWQWAPLFRNKRSLPSTKWISICYILCIRKPMKYFSIFISWNFIFSLMMNAAWSISTSYFWRALFFFFQTKSFIGLTLML